MQLLPKLLVLACLLLSSLAQAAIAPDLLKPLAGDDPDTRVAAVARIAALATPEAARVLRALQDGSLYAAPDGKVYLVDGEQAYDPASGRNVPLPDGIDGVMVNNRLRAAVAGALSGLQLLAPERTVRLAAAQALQQAVDSAQLPLIRTALARENDADIKQLLQLLIASANLQAPDAATRKAAVQALAGSSDARLLPVLQAMLEKGGEPDEAVQLAAIETLRQIKGRVARMELAGNVFYGISLGSVLLLAALGLAITFGLMGIINMAHGELLMIGAYTTYLCQLFFRTYLPGLQDMYLLAALPAAFFVAGLVGVALERTVIRWLYGRPLETLLATSGISLILMQLVRTIFGAQNVEVANPAWMSGGVTVLGGLVLPYNRLAIIVFAVVVVVAVWLILNKTRLGLFVRAVTQNRRMADCVGVATGKVDMLTFGLGSGIAGL
ncbi:MAG: urea ABC transporter permease subunit UrtB, partial [Janthinobacterium sp.]